MARVSVSLEYCFLALCSTTGTENDKMIYGAETKAQCRNATDPDLLPQSCGLDLDKT